MTLQTDDFRQFEHEGWQRIAAEYDSAWNGLVRPFVPHLLGAARVGSGTRLLDVACGPGYASEAAHVLKAIPTGLDFSSEMIRIARKHNPWIRFQEGDAQDLDFAEDYFDSVVMNFGLLHLSMPETAFAEACRVLRPGGWYGFTIWATPDKNPGSRIVQEAVEAYSISDVQLPRGPDYFCFSNPEECRRALERVGFDPESLVFQTRTIEWEVPSVSYLFDSELNAGVRTAAILAAQTPGVSKDIRMQIEKVVKTYAKKDGFVIPFTAHIVAARVL
ncbi:MAG: methyltransferase domain-containing protein [Desulfobacula sp.]|nr:methyltransferase domain-containing protein [Desulfobacula sp.]